MKSLESVAIVLVEPSHPGNIGAVARAMKTMGLTDLRLVNPKSFPHEEATRRSAGADDVLSSAQCFASLEDAIAECEVVLGTSVRVREVNWPTYTPREVARRYLEESQQHYTKLGIVFGRERSGLTNQELDLTDAQIMIPANADYGSLNLASAVQIICYELRMSALNTDIDSEKQKPIEQDQALTANEARQQPASKQLRQQHLKHLEQVLLDLDFIKTTSPEVLFRKLARLYNKANLSYEEIQILRGILTAIQNKIASN